MEKAYAMVIEEYGKELVRHEFDIPQPVGGEVIIRILASGICGSDVHVWKGQDKRSHLPQILGHRLCSGCQSGAEGYLWPGTAGRGSRGLGSGSHVQKLL